MTVDPDRPLADLVATGVPDDPMHAAWYNRGVADARSHLLSAEEAGEQLDLSAHSVRRRALAGDIGYVRMRRDGVADEHAPIKFRQSHIDAYMDENEMLPAAAEDETVTRRRQRPRTPLQDAHSHLLPRRQRQTV